MFTYEKVISLLKEWFGLKSKLLENLFDKDFTRKHFREGDIWYVKLGVNIGKEQNGGKNFLRPVLILKKFNSKCFIGIPLTSRNKKESKFYLKVKIDYSSRKVRKVKSDKSYLILSQIRFLDSIRLSDKLGKVDKGCLGRAKLFTKALLFE